ncbi:CAP domain-containing protein [Methylobacterium sp. NEAU 140]|uniref:CAP domain-containing protein n=1 Tax=Methylobacterium sp. NEAU 140 TaxID=3064945 RepID=UPI0027375566|nr:CAP domain-containing protein [Methylobacterium sp. NEAU 140]MDP4021658.1 CAP domain-containing protein [Methylobacterium sp. NEAU 140]
MADRGTASGGVGRGGVPRRLAALAALAGTALLGACTTEAPRTTGALPSLYLPLANDTAHIDVEAARDMISAYRRNRGAAPLAVDPDLQRLAEAEAAAMAAADRPSRAQTVKAAVSHLGYADVGANLSAGYHTLAEAFSGWRESPPHDATMLDPKATRMGIATAYAPGSKYKVYWALLTAK